MATRKEIDVIQAVEAKLLKAFGATPVKNTIAQMQLCIQLSSGPIGNVYIDFRSYPQSPPILSISDDIKPHLNLSFSLEAVKNWDVNNPPHIKEIIYEFLQKAMYPGDSLLVLKDSGRLLSMLSVTIENEFLNKLEKSVKDFFRDRMEMDIKTSISYCETKEEFIRIYRNLALDSLQKEELIIPEGTFILNEGVFINKAMIREMTCNTIQHYFSHVATVIVHELIGHGYLTENTSFGKMISGPIQMNRFDLAVNPLIRNQACELIFEVAKFTQEGWSEWVNWFFQTHYDDPGLSDIILLKEEREKEVYHELKTFIGYLQALLTYIRTGNFVFENYLPPYPYQQIHSGLIQQQISLEMINHDFEKFYQLLETILQDFSDFTKENYEKIIQTMQILSDFDKKYAVIFPILRYGIGFLIFKRIHEKYSPVCVPELMKLIFYKCPEPDLTSILNYYGQNFKNWPDLKLALLLAIPVTPKMRIDVKECKEVVQNYLF